MSNDDYAKWVESHEKRSELAIAVVERIRYGHQPATEVLARLLSRATAETREMAKRITTAIRGRNRKWSSGWLACWTAFPRELGANVDVNLIEEVIYVEREAVAAVRRAKKLSK